MSIPQLQSYTEHLLQKVMNRLGFTVGEHTLALFRGLQWNTPAAFVARVLCGVASLGVARWLGPSGYGEANLALAATFWIQVPLFLGIPTALMHYVPQAEGQKRSEYASSGLVLLALVGVVTLSLGFLFQPFWAHLQGITSHTFRLALVWCAGFALYVIATSLLSAYELFAARAKFEVVFAVFFALGIAGAKVSGHLHASIYVLVFAVAYGLTGIWALAQAWPAPFFKAINPQHIKELASYGLLASLLNIVHALFNAPGRLIVNRYLPLSAVGILSAYQAGSIQMAFFFIGIVSRVFFPIASRTSDRAELFRKVNRFMWLSSLPLILIYAVGLIATIYALGKNYPLRWVDLFVFSTAATLTTFYGLFSWLLASEGKRGIIIFSLSGLVAGGINAWGSLYFVPLWGITGAAVAQAIACLTGVILCRLPVVARLSKRPHA